jgi:hypothetical protein
MYGPITLVPGRSEKIAESVGAITMPMIGAVYAVLAIPVSPDCTFAIFLFLRDHQ